MAKQIKKAELHPESAPKPAAKKVVKKVVTEPQPTPTPQPVPTTILSRVAAFFAAKGAVWLIAIILGVVALSVVLLHKKTTDMNTTAPVTIQQLQQQQQVQQQQLNDLTDILARMQYRDSVNLARRGVLDAGSEKKK